ncbi:MAG: hypothetical protein WD336_11020, partial [Trueperaceae bacterium]
EFAAIVTNLRTLLGTGLSDVFWLAVAITAAALIASMLLPSAELTDEDPQEDPQEASGASGPSPRRSGGSASGGGGPYAPARTARGRAR